ncbi:MAG: aldehyde dehydrogenase [Eubacterium sp.]|nr:aldehyde dehydrogenase [Eubacterium sp.]
MTVEEISKKVEEQKKYFASGKTMPVENRIKALKKLMAAICRNEDSIAAALKKDLGKSVTEAYMCEIGVAKSEITYMLRHINRFAAEKRVLTPLAQFAAKSYVKPVPYGVTLIMSPWNYPFLLTIEPLTDALAAGNTAVVKPSAYSPATSEVVEKIIAEAFDPGMVTVVNGGREENRSLLQEPFDYVFFTGSQAVGKEVLRNCADRLTPATLELGGKSPVIVDSTAKIPLAARRIVFGKYLNCGQTCVAPDYIYCHASVKDRLVQYLKKEIIAQFSEAPLNNGNYGRIINEKHFLRICGLIDDEKLAYGGKADREGCRIEPSIMDNVTWDDAIMQEEIFGPVLPILTYESLKDTVQIINSKPRPLALYLFTENNKAVRYVTQNCQFGGGCINDTIIHLATSRMGFGGVGESGMGSYHGKDGFDTFSHRKSIVNKATWMDLSMRYQPYTREKGSLIRRFLK